MARNYINSNLPAGLVTANNYGLIDLNQIEHGDEIYTDLEELKRQVTEYGVDTRLYRKKNETIMEQDIDPSLTYKINYIFDNMYSVIDGIDYEGRWWTIRDIMLLVLDNKNSLTMDTVVHI